MEQGDQLGAFEHLEGWDGEGVGGDTRGRRYGDICIRMADSLCCTTEAGTTL